MITPKILEIGVVPTESGHYVTERIDSRLIVALEPYQVHFQDSAIETIRSKNATVTTPHKYHLDVDIDSCVAANRELVSILRRRFPYIRGRYVKIGSLSSLLCAVTARKARPFFERRGELDCLKASFGGRSEIFEPSGRGDIVEYDIKSSYPAAAMLLLPAGTPVRVPVDSPVTNGYIDVVCASFVAQNDIGMIPVRHQREVVYPREGKFSRCWLWWDELLSALELSETYRDLVIHARYRIRATPLLKSIMGTLIELRARHKEHEKTLKQIANQVIGMFCYKGGKSEVFFSRDPAKVGPGCWLLDRKLSLWGKRTETSGFPQTYRPLIASKIWSYARQKLNYALMQTARPIQCHVDGIISHFQGVAPIGTRLKKEYGKIEFECPWRGAFFANGQRVKAPGIRRE